MNRAEPLVARDDATTALVFDVFKECTHDGGRYVEHRQMVDCHRGSSTDKWKQERQRVAVTDLSVVGKVTLADLRKLGAEDGDLVGQLFDDGLIAVDHQDLPGYVGPFLGVKYCVGDMERFARFYHLV